MACLHACTGKSLAKQFSGT